MTCSVERADSDGSDASSSAGSAAGLDASSDVGSETTSQTTPHIDVRVACLLPDVGGDWEGCGVS